MKPESKAAGIGAATLAIGAALALAPGRCARLLRFPDGRETGVRLVGIADLALVPGLIKGRPRWPWMLARMASNVAIGAWTARVAWATGRRAPLAFTGAMVVATAADSTIARPLVAARR